MSGYNSCWLCACISLVAAVTEPLIQMRRKPSCPRSHATFLLYAQFSLVLYRTVLLAGAPQGSLQCLLLNASAITTLSSLFHQAVFIQTNTHARTHTYTDLLQYFSIRNLTCLFNHANTFTRIAKFFLLVFLLHTQQVCPHPIFIILEFFIM